MEENHYFWSVWRCVFRRAFLQRAQLQFHEEIPYGEDTVFLLEACLAANAVRDIPDALYVYRKNPAGVTTVFWERPDALTAFCQQDAAKRALLEQHLEPARRHWREQYAAYCQRVYLPLLLKGARTRMGRCAYPAMREILSSEAARFAFAHARLPLRLRAMDTWVYWLARRRCCRLAYWVLKYGWLR
jgi:hypothetical protein